MKSNRGIDLIISTDVRPLLTVENYDKWYQLQLVTLSGHVIAIDYPDDLEVTPFIDHAPNPVAVMRFAGLNGWLIDPEALKAIRAAWDEARGV